MTYSKDQYKALIEEQLKEVTNLDSLSKTTKQSGLRKLIGWITIALMFVTFMFGGMSGSSEGMLVGIFFFFSLIYWLKLVKEDGDLESKLAGSKEKLRELQDKHDNNCF